MSAAAVGDIDRIEALLADRVTEGLAEGREQELTGLLREHPEVDPLDWELTAALVDQAFTRSAEEPPEALRQKLEAQATHYLRDGEGAERARAKRLSARRPAPKRRARGDRGGWLSLTAGGWVAAAIFAVLALSPGPAPPESSASPSPSMLASWVAGSADVVRLEWSATDDPAASGASGQLLWSPARQEGYMRFRGLPANDPSQAQYQLWIFDGERSDAHPVDGGVFDIPAGRDEVIVPIDARLPVGRAVLFAVTIERPGGVVVSSRERLPLLAKVGSL